MSWGFELIDVEKRYGSVRALDGFDLGARMGSITALVGPAGCGKTTVFRLLAGLERPDVGAVLVAGKDIGNARGGRLKKIQSRMAVVFDAAADGSHALFGTATVLENVEFPMRAVGRVPRRRLELVARTELDRFGLGALSDELPGALSRSQRKSLALARAFAMKAPLVLVDDLAAGLDGPGLHDVCRLIREECTAIGATWFVTERSAVVAEAVADEVQELVPFV
ncbi:putative ABC transporter ATP-binding protein [Paraconexibacter sp. AEG42_29]|uniref:ABC transporter ATP-binding protein n=1 Tax=Paraconexibacter sp. AEG42_29 TaxID=2997339 RepID=A0AAU7ARX3_9ACTN